MPDPDIDVLVEIAVPEVTVEVPVYEVDVVAGSGLQGPPGPPGPPGAANSTFAAEWNWVTKTTDAQASGQLGANSAEWMDATNLHVNQQRGNGTDVTPYLSKIATGDQLNIRHKTDSTRYATYNVVGSPQDMGTWWRFPVAVAEHGGAEPNGGAATIFTVLSGPQTAAVLERLERVEERLAALEGG